jgi:hypothetical protein
MVDANSGVERTLRWSNLEGVSMAPKLVVVGGGAGGTGALNEPTARAAQNALTNDKSLTTMRPARLRTPSATG